MPVRVPRQGREELGAPPVHSPGGSEAEAPSTPPATLPQPGGEPRPSVGLAKGGLTLLVIEDAAPGALSVPEILDAASGYLPGGPGDGSGSGERVRVRTARNLTEAERLLTHDVQCILLDLTLTEQPAGEVGVPGHDAAAGHAGEADDTGGTDEAEAGAAPDEADEFDECGDAGEADAAGEAGGVVPTAVGAAGGPGELDMLRHVLQLAPRHAVLALTDGTDAERAAAAVSVGAQDYLFRDELDGRLLRRAIRYAVERKRADLAQQKLAESRLRAQENARLERGLLPTPLLEGSDLRFAARYRPGRSRALLGGDFYDTVRTSDGTVHAMIGDVCGHGPDEAALGVELRIAWRTLTFAGLCGDELLGTLQKVLEHERATDEVFATLCTVDISPDGRSAGVCLAGHPSPLVAGGGGGGGSTAPRLLPYAESGPPLGVVPKARWPRRHVELGRAWSLLMYTDGLIEGRVGEGDKRLGPEGMVDLVAARMAQGSGGEALLDATMADVRALNGGELTDDVAVLLLGRG